MALTVESGAGLSTAESYISVADADSYHSLRGNTAWAAIGTTATKEAALRRATDYMVQVYRLRWKGVRMQATQALDWPRSGVYTEPFMYGGIGEQPYLVADDIVPTDVARACASLALKASSEDLSPALERSTKREKVGPLEVEYTDGAVQYKRYRDVDNMLGAYLETTAVGKTLERG
jgi:hypothetical protein